MARLWSYFGPVGIASIVAWGAALALLSAFPLSRRRTPAYLAALALSILGFVLAKVNSHAISQIQVAQDEPGGDSGDGRGVRSSPQGPALPLPPGPPSPEPRPPSPEPRPSSPEPDFAFRGAGKQKREEGKRLTGAGPAASSDEADFAAARRLPEADLLRADAYDRLNLFFARLTPWLATLLVCLDYLSRFNRTIGYLPPIPIAGRTLDSLFPKTHAVHLRTTRPETVRRLLEDIVRKGETFLYLGQADPVPANELHRLRLGALKALPLKKIVPGVGAVPADSDFILDSIWFGRYCVVVPSPDAAQALVPDAIAYLRARTVPRATARRTVHIVWNLPSAPATETVAALAFLCRETNFKLIVVSPQPPSPDAAPLFDERLESPQAAGLRR